MSHEEREHRSAPVLTKEQLAEVRRREREWRGICDSHEALRAERDALLVETAAHHNECVKLRAERDAALAYAGREEETSRKLARDLEAALAEVARLLKLKDKLRHIHTLSEDDDDE